MSENSFLAVEAEIDSVVKKEDAISQDKHEESSTQFDRKAEARLRTKIDLHVVPVVSLLCLFCFIDRSNIGNARLAGFEADLNLHGNDFNTVLSIFYISYILFEMPTTICCKWMGPGWFLPLTTLLFGCITIATAFVHTKSQACAVRFLLGVFEAGIMPGIGYYLSRWYRRAELSFRLGLYIAMSPLSGAFGGLLASGILNLPSFGPQLKDWRMIFGVEGVITIGIALLGFLLLTDRPETARWLSEEEKQLALDRIKSERVASTEVLDKMSKKKMLRGFNPVTVPTAFVFLLNNITVHGISFFLPTIVGAIFPEKTAIGKQLLTVPPYVVGVFFVVFISGLSWRFDHRQIFMVAAGPPVVIGYAMLLATTNPHVRYGAIFLCASTIFSLGAMTIAQASANVISDTARSISIANNVMLGNFGGLISTWTYITWDSPGYPIGNGLNLACAGVSVIVASAVYWWMGYDNRRRDSRQIEAEEELAGLSQQQIENLEWEHPQFRWRP